MSKEFSRRFRVRWSEINANTHVHLAGYLHYAVETAWDWSASLGLGVEDSRALGLAWIIRETEIVFLKPLKPNDVFDFSIWLLNWRRVRGTRCFELCHPDGDGLIAQGIQQVVSLDDQSLRPVEPPEYFMGKFTIKNPRSFQHYSFPKVPPAPETAFVTQRQVQWRDLDNLEHVNNAVYASYVEDAVVQAWANLGWSPERLNMERYALSNRRFHIQYQSPAFWGDRLEIITYPLDLDDTGGRRYAEIRRISDGAQIVRCILDWVLIDPINCKERPLPSSLRSTLESTL
jgi:YbgC/YbaW family acyl-CoA thioester hydrolase